MKPSEKDVACFVLFACCIPVQGARRSTICDLQRGAYYFIPNGLYEILTEHRGKSVADLLEIFGSENEGRLIEYFDFLESKELGFWTEEPESFPLLPANWDSPDRITNAILDVDGGSHHDYDLILRQLDDLGCKALEVRWLDRCCLDGLRRLLDCAEFGRLRSIALLLGYSDDLVDEFVADLCVRYSRIVSFVVHSSPEDRRLPVGRSGMMAIYTRTTVSSPSCCGQVHPGYFSINTETWSESQLWNSCLNRKISIDTKGEIRNCPSMARSFGNVGTVSLHSALAHRDFPALWAINKDQIDVCRDCEFRYICTDCRAYIVNPQDVYSKPSKCSYDPYAAKWK